MQHATPSTYVKSAFDRFHSLFPRNQDSSLVVLKLHLLVEEQLNKILAERSKRQGCMERAKLSFAQSIWVCEALCGDEASNSVWMALRELNHLRNRMAHDLEPGDLSLAMKRFRECLGLDDAMLGLLEPTLDQTEQAAFEYAAPLIFLRVIDLVRRPSAELLKLVSPSPHAD